MKKLVLAVALLSATSTAFAADLTESCENYFKAVDGYLEQVASVDAMKGQLDLIKSQYDDSKKQISALPADQQDATCKGSLEVLEQAKAMMPK